MQQTETYGTCKWIQFLSTKSKQTLTYMQALKHFVR